MHYHRGLLVAGVFTVLAGSTVSGVASARALTGYGAFRPILPAQTCVSENWGAALNLCDGAQGMFFEAPVQSGNVWHDIWAWSYGAGYGSFTCRAESIQGAGGSWGYWGAFDTFNPSGQEARKFSAYVAAGSTLRLNCWSVPYNRGVASIVYND
jgi:hypothetical protein